MPNYERESPIAAPAPKVFEWHTRPGAFQRLTPPWEKIEFLKAESIRDGDEARFQTRLGPFHATWLAQYKEYIEGRQFVDEQVRGPFTRWVHTHKVIPEINSTCLMKDQIDYEIPLGQNKGWIARWVERRLDRLFRFRHERLQNDFKRLTFTPARPQRVLVTGASGLIGKALSAFLSTAGHEVWSLVRRPARQDTREIQWDYLSRRIDLNALEGFDAVIHLAGESIAAGRWNSKRKTAIRESRVDATRFLAENLASLTKPPKVLLCASAIGFYGDRGEEVLTEKSEPGAGFLPEVCAEWENAAEPASRAGLRVVHVRTGIVLNLKGGALPQMALPFSLGLGGVIGGGAQWMSWITLEDLIGLYYFLLVREDLSGIFNAAAPGAVTNRDFTKALGHVLNRPAVFPVPAFVVRGLFGEMGERLLLEGQKVTPVRLQKAGFEFFYAELTPALRFEMGRFL
jgi:uncharacterized protein (TIGR01777 family)